MLSTGFFRTETANNRPRLNTQAGNTPSWMPLLCVTVLYTIGAGIAYPAMFWHLVALTASEMLLFSLAFILLAVCAEALVKAPGHPLDFMLAKLKRRGPFIAAGLALFILGLSAYSTYKVNIPEIVPYYADPYFADLDRLLYGRNAWRVMHEVPPQAGLLIEFVYTRVWPGFLLFGVLGALLFLEGRLLQRYVWGLVFVYGVLGTLLATLFASVGPIFYTDFYPHAPQFTNLKPAMMDNPYIRDLVNYSNYLLEAHRSKELAFAAGISAFPSVHVGVATLSAWFLTGFGRRWAVPGWTHAVLIQYGSIYSGWHYAIDGDVSLVAVSLFWIVTSRLLGLPLMPGARDRNTGGRGSGDTPRSA